MRMLAIFYSPETVDCYTVVFNDKNPINGFYEMLGTDDNGGHTFSQFTEGQYTPGGDNSHLGQTVEFSDLPVEVKGHILHRMGA